MRKFKMHGLRYIAFGIVALGVFGLITAGLWNALVPAIFGLPAISFFQALGLLLLSRILFGRFGFRRRGRFPRFASEMTNEEREKFRQAMANRCGAVRS